MVRWPLVSIVPWSIADYKWKGISALKSLKGYNKSIIRVVVYPYLTSAGLLPPLTFPHSVPSPTADASSAATYHRPPRF